ncbi:MAG: BREX-1 system phosphatase PglZ type A, partial [Deltaproteobacteria bacterium]|nr:BREX-1 system phosphatase PglZ type A [Deltaproteobacteria bacterium]
TADHGFIYQKLELDEADFIEVDSAAAGIGKLSRRFIVGQNMDKNPSLWNITASSVGLEGQTELQFPRSINRLRKKGSGKQFVHGGAALQEIVIPCLSIKKLRVSDVSKVEVSVLGQTSVITTNQVTISFYQEEPVNEKVQGRTIKVGFFKKTGELISDSYEINFDSAQTESTLREVKRTFNFTRSSENNLECLLKLTSKIEGANQFSPYKEANYLLRKTFVADF